MCVPFTNNTVQRPFFFLSFFRLNFLLKNINADRASGNVVKRYRDLNDKSISKIIVLRKIIFLFSGYDRPGQCSPHNNTSLNIIMLNACCGFPAVLTYCTYVYVHFETWSVIRAKGSGRSLGIR